MLLFKISEQKQRKMKDRRCSGPKKATQPLTNIMAYMEQSQFLN